MVVVGAGRVGTALAMRAEEFGQPVALVDRGSGWEALEGGQGVPVLLAVRNDDLGEVVARVPVHRRGDLVTLQNGMLRPWLRERGLAQVTRGLLYFAVPTRGHRGTPGRLSPFCGPHALGVAHWLTSLGLSGWAVDWARFSYLELEKLVWICALGPLCQQLDATVGEVATAHRPLLASLVSELNRVCRASTGVDVPDEFLVDAVCSYSLEIADFRASVKELPWRNGWLLHEAERRGLHTPVHHSLLEALGVEVPPPRFLIS